MLSTNPEGIVFYSDVKDYLIDVHSVFPYLVSKITEDFLGGEQYKPLLCSECNKRFWIKFINKHYKEFASTIEKVDISQSTETDIKLSFLESLLEKIEYTMPSDWMTCRWNPKSEFKTEYARRLLKALTNMDPQYMKLTMILLSEEPESIPILRSYLKQTDDLSIWLTYVNICCTKLKNCAEGFKVLEKLIDLKEGYEKLFILYRYLIYKLSFKDNPLKSIKVILNAAYNTLAKKKKPFKEINEITAIELLSFEKLLDSLIQNKVKVNTLHKFGYTGLSLLFIFSQWVKYELHDISYVTDHFNTYLPQILESIQPEILKLNSCAQVFSEQMYNDHLKLVHYNNKINLGSSPRILKFQTETYLKLHPYGMYGWLLYLERILKTSVISNKIFTIKSIFGAHQLSLYHYTLFLVLELSYEKNLSKLRDEIYHSEPITKLFKDGWINHSKQVNERVIVSSKETMCHELSNRGLYEDYYITRKYWHLYVQYVFQNYDKVNSKEAVRDPHFDKYSLLAMNSCSYDKKVYLNYYKMHNELNQTGEINEEEEEIQRKQMEDVFAVHNEKEVRFNTILNPI